MPYFNIDHFKRRLAETIAWCQPRFDVSQQDQPIFPVQLRTPPLPDELYCNGVEISLGVTTHLIKPRLNAIAPFAIKVFKKREEAFKQHYFAGLSGGRLLVNIFLHETCEGTSPAEIGYFIDDCDVPAWDIWVYYGSDKSRGPYLISWIPSEMLSDVNRAVKVNSLEAIQWIEDCKPPLSFADEIRQAGLFFEGK